MHISRLREIEAEAESLRASWKSFSDLERLDLLDRMIARYGDQGKPKRSGYSRLPASDFATLAASVPVDSLISVIGNHMDVLQQIYPKEYSMIMQKLREL